MSASSCTRTTGQLAGRAAHRRPVHRERLYEHRRAQIPYLRRKVDAVIGRAGFDPASYSGRALINVLESYPRDELFQVDVDTLLSLRHRHPETVRAAARPRACRASTSSTASSRCSSTSRRTATTRTVRQRVGEFLAKRLRGPPLGRLSGLSRKARWRARITSSAATAARRRTSTATTLEARHRGDRAHLGRRAARCAAATTTGAAAPGARDALSPTRSRPPTARLSRRRTRIADIGDRSSGSTTSSPRAVDLLPARRRRREPRQLKIFTRGAAVPLSRAGADARKFRLQGRQRADLPHQRRRRRHAAPTCTT